MGQVQDALGNLVSTGPDSAVTVTLALTTGTGVLSGALSKQAIGGVANFADNALSINLAGVNKRLTASTTIAAGSINAVSNAFSVTAAQATHLVFSTQPGGGAAHVAWAQQPVARVQDKYGNTVTSGADSTVNIVLTLSAGTGALAGGTTTVTAVAGQAAFVGLYIDAAGSKQITATAAALSQGSTSRISTSFSVVPNTATTVAFGVQPSASTVALVPFLRQPVVTISDSYGNSISSGPDATATVTLTLTGGTGTLGGTVAMAAIGGVADFAGKGLNIDLVGANKVLTATKSNTSGGGGTASLTGTTSAFSIRYGSATSIAFLAQPAGAVAAAALGVQPVVEILDAAGNVVTGGVDATANITLALGSGTGTLSGSTTVAAAAGVATFAGLSVDLVGSKTLLATKADTASATAAGVIRGTPATQATSNSFLITQDTALHLVFTTQPSGSVAGHVWGTQPVVKIVDAHDNVVTTGADASRVVTMTLSQGTGPLGGALSVTAAAGVATFTDLQATAIGAADVLTANAVLTGGAVIQDSVAFVITSDAASRLAYTIQPGGGTAGVAWSQQPVLQVQDQYGNLVSTGADSSVLVTLAKTTGTGTLSGALSKQAIGGVADFSDNALALNLTGSNKVLTASATITAGAVSRTSNAFTIVQAPASQLVFATQPGGGTAHTVWGQQPVVQVQDRYGNLVTTGVDSNVNIVLTLTSGSGALAGTTTVTAIGGQATFAGLKMDAAGTKTITATAAALSPGSTARLSSSFVIVPNTPTTVVFAQQPSASTVSQVVFARQPLVTISDSYGNLVTSGPDATALVTLSLSTGAGSLGGTLSMAAVGGIANFAGKSLNIDLIGNNKVLTATKADTTGSGGTAALSTTTGAFSITSGTATHLAFGQQPVGGGGHGQPCDAAHRADSRCRRQPCKQRSRCDRQCQCEPEQRYRSSQRHRHGRSGGWCRYLCRFECQPRGQQAAYSDQGRYRANHSGGRDAWYGGDVGGEQHLHHHHGHRAAIGVQHATERRHGGGRFGPSNRWCKFKTDTAISSPAELTPTPPSRYRSRAAQAH